MTYFEQLHARIGALAATQVFFIGGSMKSGTTWLQLLLDAHPAVACKGESHVANHLARLLMQSLEQHNQFIAEKNRTIFKEIAGFPLYDHDDLAYLIASALLLGLAKADAGAPPAAIGEKTPDNVRLFDVLHAIFPRAKFIHLVRDGRDCAMSGWFHRQRCVPAGGRAPGALDDYVQMFAREWAKDLAEGAAFAEAHPSACRTVRYEDLVRDAGPALLPVFEFLGVPTDADTLAGCVAAGAFERLSGGRRRGQEDRGSFFRNGVPGDWRRHMDDGLGDTFRRVASPWLEQFGYS